MIGIAGAGAFGTALAITLGREGRAVQLWARDPEIAVTTQSTRRNKARLPDVAIPPSVQVTGNIDDLRGADAVLLTMPMQVLHGFLQRHAGILNGLPIIACCKGIDLATLKGPSSLIQQTCADSTVAQLTGPSFATDIAYGLPTALTLACKDDGAGEALQKLISTPSLRVYRTSDVIGAELGGALKNVIAIAAGIVVGAGLGESARAALMTRGYAEMVRFGLRLGGRAETLAGLSGLGDLVLTCTSTQSRNFRHGLAMGRGELPDAAATVEGVATAQAVIKQSIRFAMASVMPVTAMVASVTTGQITVAEAVQALMSRPLKQE